MNNTKLALHGSYYGDNFGDTLFVLHFLNWILEEDLSTENIVLPFASDRVRKLANVSDNRGIKSILRSDKIVFIGGGYLGERPETKLYWSLRLIKRHLSIALISYFTKKPYIFIGVGAGPLSNIFARKLTVYVCNRSEKTIVRDSKSLKYLLEYGVNESKLMLTADSILTLDQLDLKKNYSFRGDKQIEKTNNEILIGVHLPAASIYNNKLEVLVKDLKKYVEANENVKVVIFNDFYNNNFNYSAYEYIKKEISTKKITFIDYLNPYQLIDLISELDIVITTKLHCGIVANCLGKYAISISVHEKTTRFYKQIDLADRNFSLINYKKGILNSLLNNYDKSQCNKTNIPEKIRNLAYMNKTELLSFINDSQI